MSETHHFLTLKKKLRQLPYIYVCIYIYIHTHVYIYIHTHIYITNAHLSRPGHLCHLARLTCRIWCLLADVRICHTVTIPPLWGGSGDLQILRIPKWQESKAGGCTLRGPRMRREQGRRRYVTGHSSASCHPFSHRTHKRTLVNSALARCQNPFDE